MHVKPAPVRACLLWRLLRPTVPPVGLGFAMAAFFIVAESLVVVLLKQVVPGNVFGVVYLLGVLVVSTVCGSAWPR
ncbi:MAG: hypothetical protein JWR32_2032 [Mycobacterium sp.]|nr:hypothetical protein [Mycobacterium sp.]